MGHSAVKNKRVESRPSKGNLAHPRNRGAPGGYGKDPPTARILRRLAAKAKKSKP
jgi:hypothetical protein